MTIDELMDKLYEWKELGLSVDQVKTLFLTELAREGVNKKSSK